jgi:hypothetical protein
MNDLIVAEHAAAVAAPCWPSGSRQIAEPYEIQVERWGALRVAHMKGEMPVDLMTSSFHILGVQSDGAGETCILVDLRELRTDYSPCDLICLGQELASSFVHLDRVALLARPTQSSYISERVARFTGMDLRAFVSEEDAVGWLLDTRETTTAEVS